MKAGIEEIKLLIPDYITGKLGPVESELVRSAIEGSDEIRILHDEMSEGLGLVSTVKLSEPPPQYWASLLPRIHERIERKVEKRFSLGKLAMSWKVLVPAAALILFAIFYFTVLNKPDASEMTNINTEEKLKDTAKDDVIKQSSKNLVNETDPVKDRPDTNENRKVRGKLPVVKKNEIPVGEEKDEQIEIPVNKSELTDVIPEEESVFTGEAAGFEEEIDTDLNQLTEEEQNSLIKELDKSNL